MIDRPNFTLARRGYAAEEVDAFLETQNRTLQAAKKDASERSVELTKLNAALADLRGQLSQQSRVMAELKRASTPAPSQAFVEIGERVGQILTLADTEATEMVARATAQAEALREQAATAADEQHAAAAAYAQEAHQRVDEESTRIIAQATREARAIVAEAQSVTASQRREAAAEYESHRAKASAASAELETTLAARRDQADREFEARRQAAEAALAEADQRVKQLTARAQQDAAELHARGTAALEAAQAQADQVVSEAHDHASRLREESDRELAAATSQRDSITGQLSNVRQMLATLGGGVRIEGLAPADDVQAADVPTNEHGSGTETAQPAPDEAESGSGVDGAAEAESPEQDPPDGQHDGQHDGEASDAVAPSESLAATVVMPRVPKS
ncbi:MAG: hypothetical protein L0H96_25455 [Humibacillus sp.]|nr:hypothetical protein [Humibacillus sp.]MDN5780227.1 hypothetical protein [Humibacillus sp.]